MDVIYPKTRHLLGSKGLVEAGQVLLGDLRGPLVTVEEKLDGTQVAICFEGGRLLLTTRSGPLPKTESFARFSAWAGENRYVLQEVLWDRYVLWGEWLFAKHTMFYDGLTSYFYEYDIFDREDGKWLSTPRRHHLLRETGIQSVPVLYRGPRDEVILPELLAPSLFKTEDPLGTLRAQCLKVGQDFEDVSKETAILDTEGLFVKSETEDVTLGWYKYIRPGFVEAILASGSHWRDRPVLPNLLR